jgi:CheY-like chemotaxis protein/HPt (histidine-containing phosphotransfer) domain-containing protein
MTDLLLDTPLDNEQTEFARIIKMSADALLAIINDILDFSKIEAGRMVLEHTGFSLRQIIEGSLDVLAGKALEKDLKLASFVAPELPDHLIGDPTRVRQILLNFLSNAVKFTARGQVLVSATLARESGDDCRMVIKLAVRDNGIGLTETAKASLFQPFSQTDSSTTRMYGGTGLGLSICKRLVEVMGGEIGVDSVAGEGSTFWVQIPLEVSHEKRTNIRPEEILRGKRVLVAGNDADSRAILCSYFEAWQVNFEYVAGLAELRQRLAELEGKGQPPDALLLTLSLSDATLIEAVAALQAEHKHSPLVCCLAQADGATKAALVELGASVVYQPLNQSKVFNVFAATPNAEPTAPARRMSDVAYDASTETGQTVGDRHHLLLAEDNPVNQRVAMHMLTKLGYAVDVVDNGALAVTAVASGNYALVLMDCQMPEMDGFAATDAIRRAETHSRRHVPIIAMTANALQGDREQCLAAGMDDYIAKPIDAIRLTALLAAWLPENAGATVATPFSVASPRSGPSVTPSEPAPPLDAEDTGPVPIDLNRLTDLFGDDDAVVDELLEVFENSLQPLREKLKLAVRDRDHNLKSVAHELRGASANVGALPLAEVAGQMEKYAASGNWGEIGSAAARIDSECIRAIDFIARRNEHRKG